MITIDGGTGKITHSGANVAPKMMFDRWRLTGAVTGAQDPITGTFARSNSDGRGTVDIGSGMSVSSGIWTFPVTGIYKVEAHWSLQNSSSSSTWCDMDILFAQDGTNYSAMSRAVASVSASGYYSQPITTLIVDVTDASVCKLKFKVNYAHASTSVRGDGSGSDYSWFDFIRLADT